MRFVAGELMPFRWSGCLHDTSSQDTTVYDVCAYIFDDIKIGTRENFYGVLIIDTRVEFFVFFFFYSYHYSLSFLRSRPPQDFRRY